MDWDVVVQYYFLQVAVFILVSGLTLRLIIFLFTIAKSSIREDRKFRFVFTALGRSLVPFHMAVKKRTLYTIPRYFFHIGLIVIPIWYSRHIALWETYGFEWYWTALPDEWIDSLTLLVLGFAVYFSIRRIFSEKIRRRSMKSDYLVIIITALPFLTGYALTHGSLDAVPFIGGNIENIHVLTAEAMIVMVAFLFCRVRLNEAHCIGCTSCELSCPTGALVSNEVEKERIFLYAVYRCICCGTCMITCPEAAVEVGHEVRMAKWPFGSGEKLLSVSLKTCEKCGIFFAPDAQLNKLRRNISEDYLCFCQKCKQRESAKKLFAGK